MRVSKRKNNTFESFSEKQLRVLSWWCPSSPDRNFDAIICDGAVRSGKTVCMSVSFVAWAFSAFDDTSFALCGKTVTSLRRNIITPILPVLRRLGFDCREKLSQHLVEIEYSGRRNRFYLFGGKDEGSAALIQGMTLAGVFLDEVVLMPRSFVEQACARCSVEGSRLWFSCNPEGPQHWFYKEWILQADKRNCLHLHFTMQDNPSLSQTVRRRYERLYTGVFYRRFILGQWCQAEGRVYDFFDTASVRPAPGGVFEQWVISCDYGTVNPASFGLWGKQNGVWYRTDEFYFDSRREGRQMTDAEYAEKLRKLAGGRTIREVIVDPSAASFHGGLAARGLEGAEGGQRCDLRDPKDGGCTERGTDRDLRAVHGLLAGDGFVCLGSGSRRRPGGEEERPRDGRYAVFCDGRSDGLGGLCRVRTRTEDLKGG